MTYWNCFNQHFGNFSLSQSSFDHFTVKCCVYRSLSYNQWKIWWIKDHKYFSNANENECLNETYSIFPYFCCETTCFVEVWENISNPNINIDSKLLCSISWFNQQAKCSPNKLNYSTRSCNVLIILILILSS